MVHTSEKQELTKEFFLGGYAVFTVSSPETHWTYMIEQSYDGTKFFAKFYTGEGSNSDPESYVYLGMVDQDTGFVFLTKASKMSDNTMAVRVLRHTLNRVWLNETDAITTAGWSLEHCGICGRCGRTLTNPESIRTGIGPICADKIWN